MIIGNGLLANAFAGQRNIEGVVVLAAGVSNSLETRESEFERERKIIESAIASNPGSTMVYFGSCSIFDPDRISSPYVRHKLEMEKLVSLRANSWRVFRLGLAIGPRRGGTTLHEFLYERIASGEVFDVWSNAVRLPIDVEDVARISREFIPGAAASNGAKNVFLREYSIFDFISTIEAIVGRKARYRVIERGGRARLPDNLEVLRVAEALSVDMSEAYLDKVLRKYLGQMRSEN